MKKLLLAILLSVPVLGFAQNCKEVKTTVDDMEKTTTYHAETAFHNSFLTGISSKVEFLKTSGSYSMIFTYIFQSSRSAVIGTTEKILIKLYNDEILTVQSAKIVTGIRGEAPLVHNQITTILVPIRLTEEQMKKIADFGIQKVRLTLDDETVDEEGTKALNKSVMKIANCVMQQ